MKIAIVGGNLQGIEAAYLAKSAGYEVLLVDKRASPPARFLSDRCIEREIQGFSDIGTIFDGVDLVLPALEDELALETLFHWGRHSGAPVAFGLDAYRITVSKKASDALFKKLHIPSPVPWPDCGFPLVAKPSSGSGSRNVVKLHSSNQAARYFDGAFPPDGWVVQEYVHGPSYSIEVIGRNGKYRSLVITELFMDRGYDCKRVIAPVALPAEIRDAFEDIAVTLAGAVSLSGIMDVEVIHHDGKLKVLEIDARLPSQTPIAVYHATGVNMVTLLADLFLADQLPMGPLFTESRGCVLEHIGVSVDSIRSAGEHLLSGRSRLKRIDDFFGADAAFTDYEVSASTWAATLIMTGSTPLTAMEKRNQIIARIQRDLKLDCIVDENPYNLAT